MKAVYISHPFGGKAFNLTQASKWVAWAARQEGIAPMAPWIILCQHFTEEEGRTRGLAIDICHVQCCSEVWICGPKICGDKLVVDYSKMGFKYENLSPGMAIEIGHAVGNLIPVVDQRPYAEFVL